MRDKLISGTMTTIGDALNMDRRVLIMSCATVLLAAMIGLSTSGAPWDVAATISAVVGGVILWAVHRVTHGHIENGDNSILVFDAIHTTVPPGGKYPAALLFIDRLTIYTDHPTTVSVKFKNTHRVDINVTFTPYNDLAQTAEVRSMIVQHITHCYEVVDAICTALEENNVDPNTNPFDGVTPTVIRECLENQYGEYATSVEVKAP